MKDPIPICPYCNSIDTLTMQKFRTDYDLTAYCQCRSCLRSWTYTHPTSSAAWSQLEFQWDRT